jgi:ATP-binding cassette subfamily B protein
MEPPERPADPAVRRAYLRRIAVLFRPYRARLAGVLGLIVLSSALGSIPAFLIKEVFDTALPEHDLGLLNVLVAGMIVIAIVTGVLGVVQTLLSNQVGQRVMHDLRTSVYKHLQRLSLAFFTRTRTGEVQSRLANDIGGVQQVVTSTATSIVSNVTTVLATVVAMFVLDWRLTLFALALLPLFVWLTRRVATNVGRWRRCGRNRWPTSRASSRSRSRFRGSCSARRWVVPASSPRASRTSRRASPTSRCAAG